MSFPDPHHAWDPPASELGRGELQEDFGFLFKGPLHVDALLRVPLVWRPAPSAGVAPAEVTGPVGLMDLAPTWCEIAGVDVPDWMQGTPLPVSGSTGRGVVTEWDSVWDGTDAYKFSGRPVVTDRRALPAGDYAVLDSDEVLAAVERKKEDNFVGSLSDGSLNFQMAERGAFPAPPWSSRDATPTSSRSRGSSPAGSPSSSRGSRCTTRASRWSSARKLAEEWTYRFLAAAARDLSGP